MEGDPGEGIYLAMLEENGMPMLGTTAVKLGIRRGKDIVTDQAGRVHRPSFSPRQANGLSCVPTIQELPVFALPIEWGGTNKRTRVWKIELSDLGAHLIALDDTDPGALQRHISVGPARTMLCDGYIRAIEATRPKWKKITKP